MLRFLFDLHGSDKGFLGYGEVYDELFSPFKDKEFNFLELGIMKGASVKAWLDFFPKALILGLDNAYAPILPERARTYLGRQEDLSLLEQLVQEYKEFSIIVDDCGHVWGPQQKSFEYLWKYVTPGGLYIIEDLGTSYRPEFQDSDEENTVDYFYDKIPFVVKDEFRDQQDIDYIQFRTNMVIIRKRSNGGTGTFGTKFLIQNQADAESGAVQG